MKQVERDQKRKENEKEKQEKKQTEAMEKERKKQGTATKDQTVEDLYGGMKISNRESGENDAVCLKCRLMCSFDIGVWIFCDEHNNWYDLKCTNIRGRRKDHNTIMTE